MQLKNILLTTVVLTFLCLATKAQNCLDTVYNGTATFYLVSGQGNCSFPVPASPIYIASINEQQYDSAISCGGCVQVTSTKGSVTLTLENQCHTCGANNLDISTDVDTILSNNTNAVAIQWRYIACPLMGPVQFNITNSNAFILSVQIRNHRYPVKKVEYLADTGYVALIHQNYNYYTGSLNGTIDTFTFRITDVLGDVIVETGIPLVNDSVMNGIHQFPICTTTAVNTVAAETGLLQFKNNPSTGTFLVQNSSDAETPYTVTDILGRTLQTGKFAPLSQSQLQIQHTGVYLVSYNTNTGRPQVAKLVVN